MDMKMIFDGDVYAGLSGLPFHTESFDLGHGLSLRKTGAKVKLPFLMSFEQSKVGSYMQASTADLNFDVDCELVLPNAYATTYDEKRLLAKTIVFLLRNTVHPATRLAVFSNVPFSNIAQADKGAVKVLPFELQPRILSLQVPENGFSIESKLNWVKESWPVCNDLMKNSKAFSFAVDALDNGQFVQDDSLALVSLWCAIEALMSKETTELKFRVACYTAAYLEPPGETRLELKQFVAKLYDKRSHAAHGVPSHKHQDIVDSYNLARRLIIAIVYHKAVPTRELLERLLFLAHE